MTEKEFKNRIDGLINDYEGGISTSIELRDGILDTLIELVSKVRPFEAGVSLQNADIKEGIKKALEIITEVYKEIPLAYSDNEDARYNYPERQSTIWKRLNSILSN